MSVDLKPAATLVLVRDSGHGIETLMLRRHQQLKVGAGHWVFPGGGIDAADGALGADEAHSARAAAVRETFEEAGLNIDPEELQFLSHWTTPVGFPRRFSTWFFLAEGGHDPVLVDGEEMDDYCWDLPGRLLERHRQGELAMMPPAVVTLSELAACATVAAARAFYAAREALFIEPRQASDESLCCMLYPGDAGYDSADETAPGPRNRCYQEGGVWHYLQRR